MSRINFMNIVKSLFLGMFIGICLQLYAGSHNTLGEWLFIALVSGLIGFVIGGVTEMATAYLPVSIARPKVYFLINGLVAVVVAAIVFLLINRFFGTKSMTNEDILKFILIVMIMNLANVLDYFMYKRANKKLKMYKERIEE